MTAYKVTFQYSETTYCSNIAKAVSLADVQEYYSKYECYNIEEADASDLAEAERKGKPVVEIEHKEEKENKEMTENKTYLEQVKADVAQYMEDNEYYFNMADYRDAEDFQDSIYDAMWTADSVTGNGSGSYTFNRAEAREHVLADLDTVKEALSEFCVPAEEIGQKFLNEDWEYLDVTARCYILGIVVGEWIDENREEIEKAIEEANEEAKEA